MAVDVADRIPRERLRARVAALPVRASLATMVAASFAIRWALASLHASPNYFPDEYIYPTLARGLATTGLPTVRGEVARFPALLEPILTAPLWLLDDVLLVYRLTQGLHALVISLAAIPVYLLARRLGLGAGLGLVLAALSLAWPSVSYASFMLADPIAYPLVLTAVYLGVRALDRPAAGAQLAFLAASGLATFARVQFVVLPFAFLGAALVVERGHALRAARKLWPTLACLGVPALAGLALGPGRALGYYHGLFDLDVDPAGMLTWAGNDAMVLAYAAGWLIVPGGLVGIAQLARGGDRSARAFAALSAILAGFLLFQGALFASNSPGYLARVHERYLFTLLPLLALGFGAYVTRGLPRRAAVALLATGLLVVSVRVPLAGYTIAQGKSDSPTLRAVFHLEALIGISNGSLVVAAAAGILSLAAIGLALRPLRTAPYALALTFATTIAITVGAYAYESRGAGAFERTWQGDVRWVDRAALGPVSLLRLPNSHREAAFEQLFWNRSLERVLLYKSKAIDVFPAERVAVTRTGKVLAGGAPLRSPVLVQNWGSFARFTGAERVAARPGFELLRPDGDLRLRLLAAGLFTDGWLAEFGVIVVWPDERGRLDGTLRLELSMPPGTADVLLRLEGRGVRRTVLVPSGGRRLVEIPVRARGPWSLGFSTARPGFLGYDRRVSVRAKPPVFTPNR